MSANIITSVNIIGISSGGPYSSAFDECLAKFHWELSAAERHPVDQFLSGHEKIMAEKKAELNRINFNHQMFLKDEILKNCQAPNPVAFGRFARTSAESHNAYMNGDEAIIHDFRQKWNAETEADAKLRLEADATARLKVTRNKYDQKSMESIIRTFHINAEDQRKIHQAEHGVNQSYNAAEVTYKAKVDQLASKCFAGTSIKSVRMPPASLVFVRESGATMIPMALRRTQFFP
ncbi:hypothetical protein DIURU_004634 [Diutina rugosa]|uniref:Uncharacterized protein n=1 Tax=Diutina rugosa TaxID=5481 RepID=A0A642UGQ9_DIURU|nr:uncharacterized protein DIURU_004634 [Diutina rugosa]KAA8898614.1 hypothetical protein DIURU_004634 [Diutina rugosa]